MDIKDGPWNAHGSIIEFQQEFEDFPSEQKNLRFEEFPASRVWSLKGRYLEQWN
jgi:hypothetical protein